MAEVEADANVGMILGPGPPGRWDSQRVSSPQVLRKGADDWRMWYYGRDPAFDPMIPLPTGRVGMARSRDGIRWDRIDGRGAMGAVFEPSNAATGRFDCAHVGISDIQETSDGYRMWYFGGDTSVASWQPPGMQSTAERRGFPLRLGTAVSLDGLSWTREDGPFRGAHLDIGQPGSFDALMVGWPRLIEYRGAQMLYYHALDPSDRCFKVGLAIGSGRGRFEKVGVVLSAGKPGAFDEAGVSCRHVIPFAGRLAMFYEGRDGRGYYSIGLAWSDDGRAWHRETEEPVFRHAPEGSGRWDARAVGTPCVVVIPSGGLRLYYVGSGEPQENRPAGHAIGLAISDGDPCTWRRVGEMG